MKTTISDIKEIVMETLHSISFRNLMWEYKDIEESYEPILNTIEMYYNQLKHSDIKKNYVRINKIAFKTVKYINIRSNI